MKARFQQVEVPYELLQEWQSIVDLMAEIIGVPSGLIMRMQGDKIEVLVASDTEGNPYRAGDEESLWGSGLYCETVIKSKQGLKVPHAPDDPDWKDNPDIRLNMVSYMGFPIRWPNGDPFGTICVLDNKVNHYNAQYERLVEKFRNAIQQSLRLVETIYELKQLAHYDDMTGVLNRRAFMDAADAEARRARRYQHPASVLMLDLDRFKSINDQFGHGGGDAVLVAFAQQVNDMLRDSDIFARLGGEEFALLLPHTDLEDAMRLAERIREQVEQMAVPYDTHSITLTVSIGVAELCHEEGFEFSLKIADKALYTAKEEGRNRIRCGACP